MTLEEVQNACKAVKEGAAGAMNASVRGKTYMVLRNDEDMCYFKKKGEGGGCFGKTKTLLAAGTYNEGSRLESFTICLLKWYSILSIRNIDLPLTLTHTNVYAGKKPLLSFVCGSFGR